MIPDCCAVDTATNKDYYESYVDYYLLKNQYYVFNRVIKSLTFLKTH